MLAHQRARCVQYPARAAGMKTGLQCRGIQPDMPAAGVCGLLQIEALAVRNSSAPPVQGTGMIAPGSRRAAVSCGPAPRRGSGQQAALGYASPLQLASMQ